MYRAYLLVSIFVAVAFASERSEANVTSYSKVSRPYGTYVLMENVTYSTNPTADLMLFYGIGAFRNDSYGPGFDYGPSGWYDVPLESSAYVEWYVAASPAYGLYYTNGSHRGVLLDLTVVTVYPSPTSDFLFLSYIGV